MDLDQLLWQCFRHFIHLDESNAAVHCAPVRYSPITFRLAEVLNGGGALKLPGEEFALVRKVIDHLGKYAEDQGR